MKVCPNCGTVLNDDCVFCLTCGARYDGAPVNGAPTGAPQPQYAYSPQITFDPTDHTAEFDPADVHENKPLALLSYFFGIFLLIPVLAGKDSPYLKFHIRQNVKFLVLYAMLIFAAVLLSWTFLVPFACVIGMIVLEVVEIIGFVNCAKGYSKEMPIIKGIKFLN